MAQTLHAVLTDPDESTERDIEIREADSFLLVRAPNDLAGLRDLADFRDLADRDGSTREVTVS
ncbi:hypothetical protein [Dactylosporangium sp. CS-033363]|uniref:hypothetical protein n=1 Tax=Dactylosporangium sp. CS-033363 TaxID=3239935 RepID=UPI003D8F50AD